MSLADIYPWLKALHVAAAITFVGGALAVSVILAAAIGSPDIASIARRVRRWDRAVTMPAMLLLWVLGITLVATGQWLTVVWLQVKLPIALLLSGLHGVQSGQLHQLAEGNAIQPMRAAPLIIGCAIVIALLAVAKPF